MFKRTLPAYLFCITLCYCLGLILSGEARCEVTKNQIGQACIDTLKKESNFLYLQEIIVIQNDRNRDDLILLTGSLAGSGDTSLIALLRKPNACDIVLSVDGRGMSVDKKIVTGYPNIYTYHSEGKDEKTGALLTEAVTYSWNGKEYEDATKRDKIKNGEQLNEKALNLFRQNKIQAAIRIWKHIDEEFKVADAEVLNNLGFAYYKLGRSHYPEAIEYFQRASVVDPNRWTIYLNLGDLYKAIGQRAIAIDNYKKVLDLNPNYKYANKLKREITEFNAKHVKKMKVKEPAASAASSPTIMASKAANDLTAYEYFYRIHTRLPEYKFVLSLDKEMYPRHIDVLRSADSSLAQVLDVNDSEDINYHCEYYAGGKGRLKVVDMNFDGYQDLKLHCMSGENESYLFWLYDKESGKFIFNAELSEVSNPAPNIKTKTIISDVGMGCAGTCRNISTYKFIGNKLVLLDSQDYTIEKTAQ